MEISSGLNSSGIKRLKDTWESIDEKWKKRYENMVEKISNDKNYQNVRHILKTVSPPCIPYLGMYLTDLTFIEDGNKDTLDGLINFTKRRLISGVIQEIQQLQQTPYFLQSVPVIKSYIKNYKVLEPEKIYDNSISIISRGAEKEIDEEEEDNLKQRRKSEIQVEINFGELSSSYAFNIADNEDNITFDEGYDVPVVDSANIYKLVERLTYEKNLDNLDTF